MVCPIRLTVTAVLALPLSAGAATLSPSAFTYQGRSLSFPLASGQTAPIYAGWNPRAGAANPNVHDEGVHISFFGRSPACPLATNGPAGPLDQPGEASLRHAPVGPMTPPPGARIWSPEPDAATCPAAKGAPPGPAFVASIAGGGLELLTAVVPQTARSSAFWGQITGAGQPGKGTNGSIQGTFVSWNFGENGAQAVHPWQRGGDRPVEMSVDMAVRGAQVEAEQPGGKPNQAKQQFAVSFVNLACHKQDAGAKCEVRLMFDISLIRKPGADWSAMKWSQHARVLFDRAQGGLPVIEGPLGTSGDLTSPGGPRQAGLWRSNGAPTSHASFARQHFAAQMTFAQFTAALNLVAQRGHQQPATLFGASWNDPQAWAITALNVAQEVHSVSPSKPVFIAGTISAIQIGGI